MQGAWIELAYCIAVGEETGVSLNSSYLDAGVWKFRLAAHGHRVQVNQEGGDALSALLWSNDVGRGRAFWREVVPVRNVVLAWLVVQHLQAFAVFNRYAGEVSNALLDIRNDWKLTSLKMATGTGARVIDPYALEVMDYGGPLHAGPGKINQCLARGGIQKLVQHNHIRLLDSGQRHARQAQGSGSAKTFVACEGSRVAGYFSLTVGQIDTLDAPERIRRGMGQ